MRAALVLLMLVSLPAQAEWTTRDTALEAAFQVANFIDWGQTHYIAQHPDRFEEVGMPETVGTHPTEARVDVVFLFIALAHPVISYILPNTQRGIWQTTTAGYKVLVVASNHNIGIRMSF